MYFLQRLVRHVDRRIWQLLKFEVKKIQTKLICIIAVQRYIIPVNIEVF